MIFQERSKEESTKGKVGGVEMTTRERKRKRGREGNRRWKKMMSEKKTIKTNVRPSLEHKKQRGKRMQIMEAERSRFTHWGQMA